MRTYSFADIGSDSLYEHLYKSIKTDILQGGLHAGEKLPSKRSFAKNLGISVITVENAYEKLIAEGYIYSIPKRGFYVTDFQDRTIPKPSPAVCETVRLTGGEPHYLADFSSNQTPSGLFPFTVWAKLVREVLRDRQQALMTNPPSGGILPLRQAIADHLKAFRDMRVAPEQIIIGAGTEYLYGLLIQLLGMEKRYAVEDPGYRKISQIYKSHSVACEFVSMDACGIRVQELEDKGVDVVHISPAHHFPTGIVMPISRRYELLSWASKAGSRYIIEDDYDSELRLSGQPIPTLRSIDVSDKVIYMNTFTKTLASTIRISYMVLPQPLLRAYYETLSFYACTVSNFEQYTLARFMEEGYFEKHMNRMRNYYHHKRDAVVRAIYDSPLKKYVAISKEDTGLHFLMEIKTERTDQDFVRLLKERGVKLAPLSDYYAQIPHTAEHVFVMNYSSVDPDKIEEAVARIYQCCALPAGGAKHAAAGRS